MKCTLILKHKVDVRVYTPEGETLASKTFYVEPGVVVNLPPLVAIGVAKPGVLPLVPDGFTLPAGDKLRLYVIAVDDDSNPQPYVVVVRNGAVEKPALTWIPEYRQMIDELLDWINLVYSAVKDWVSSVTGSTPTLPKPVPGVYAGYTEVSGNAGDVLEYYAVVESGGVRVSTLKGITIFYNQSATRKAIVIDTRILTYLLSSTAKQLSGLLDPLRAWGLNPTPLKHLVGNATVVTEWFGAGVMPHWEYIAKRARLYIAVPSGALCDLLDKLEPQVIVIGYTPFGVKTGVKILDYVLSGDLSKITCGSTTLLEKLLEYIRERHAGLVVTMGALNSHEFAICDVETGEVKWVEYGVVGHIGRSVLDANPAAPRSLAAALGLYMLPVTETLKRILAEQVCKAAHEALKEGDTSLAYLLQLASTVIGSAPLVTYAPFKGELNVTWPPLSKYMKKLYFERSMPDVAKKFGLTGYTLVGWQIQEPILIYNTSWRELKRIVREARSLVEMLKEKIVNVSKLVRNFTDSRVEPAIVAETYNASISKLIEAIHDAISRANFTNGVLRIALRLSDYGQSIEISIDVKSIADKILEYLAPRVVMVSKDYLGGMLLYDVSWRLDGYRAALVTFEAELLTGDVADKFWATLLNWVTSWSYKPDEFSVIGKLVVPRKLAESFKEMIRRHVVGATLVENISTLVPERGFAKLNLTIPPGKRLVIAILHPESARLKVRILDGTGRIVRVVEGNRSTIVTIEGSGRICLGLSADADSVTVRAYLEVYEETAPSTTTVTTTVTKTVTETTTVTKTVTTSTVSTVTTTRYKTVTTTVTEKLVSTTTRQVTVTVTRPTTVTKTVEKPYTTTIVSTTTVVMEKTYTTTVPGGTATVKITVYKPTTVTTTVEKTTTSVKTTTITTTPTTTYALAAALLVIGLAIGFAIGRRR